MNIQGARISDPYNSTEIRETTLLVDELPAREDHPDLVEIWIGGFAVDPEIDLIDQTKRTHMSIYLTREQADALCEELDARITRPTDLEHKWTQTPKPRPVAPPAPPKLASRKKTMS